MSTLKIKRENGKIFCPLADSWHIETPEEKVRQEYIKILVENYGYSLDQMAQEIKVNNSQRGQGKARADIVIWKSKQDKIESKAAFIVVECKAENVRIREEDYYQGYNYASWAGASFFVTTNEKETKYFNVDKDYLPKELVEVVAIPTAEEALNDKKVKDILSKTKTFTRDDFTKILRTCHNIIFLKCAEKLQLYSCKYLYIHNGRKKNLRRPFSVKLKSVYIEKYKNLSPLTIDFELGNGLTMLVGNNGSGKSNVLEAISGIFHDLFKGKDFRYIKISSLITDPVTHTLILFIFCTHFIWSADLSCSVTPSFSAYSFTSREKRACASSSTSARWECSLPEVSRL